MRRQSTVDRVTKMHGQDTDEMVSHVARQDSTTEVAFGPAHLIISLYGPQAHGELETQEVVGANGLKLQQLAQCYQLRPREVIQGQFILK